MTQQKRIEKLEKESTPSSIEFKTCPPDATLEEAYAIYHENLRLAKSMPRQPVPKTDMTLEEATKIYNEKLIPARARTGYPTSCD